MVIIRLLFSVLLSYVGNVNNPIGRIRVCEQRTSKRHVYSITSPVSKAAYTLAILPDAARTVRERFASGYPCTHGVHCAGSSGTLRPHPDVFAVDANGSRRLGSAV